MSLFESASVLGDFVGRDMLFRSVGERPEQAVSQVDTFSDGADSRINRSQRSQNRDSEKVIIKV